MLPPEANLPDHLPQSDQVWPERRDCVKFGQKLPYGGAKWFHLRPRRVMTDHAPAGHKR